MPNDTSAPESEQPALPWPAWAPAAPVESQVEVTCAVCGFECVHIARVDVNQNGLITTVDRDNDRLEPNGPKSGRGSKEWERLHFDRLRLFRDIPIILRQFSREQCWSIVCDAVVDVSAKGGRG